MTPHDPAPIRWWQVLLGSLLFACAAIGLIWCFAILGWVLGVRA